MRPRQLLVPPPASHAPRRRRRCRASRARRAAARMGGSKNIDYSTQVTPRRGVTPRAQRAEEKIFRRIIRDNDDFVRSARCARHIMQSLATDGRRPRRFDPVRGCKFASACAARMAHARWLPGAHQQVRRKVRMQCPTRAQPRQRGCGMAAAWPPPGLCAISMRCGRDLGSIWPRGGPTPPAGGVTPRPPYRYGILLCVVRR